MRSERTVYSAMSRLALSSRSGGIDGRPVFEYSRSKSAFIERSTASACALMVRSG